MKQLIFDFGGTYIKYAYFDNDRMSSGSFPIVDENGKEDIPNTLRNFLKNYEVDEIGVSMPGPFDYQNGISLMDFKLTSIYKINLINLFKEIYPNVRVLFIHDAVAFMLGAYAEHPEFKSEVIAGIMLGTGLGYALLNHGKVVVANDEVTIPHLGFEINKETGKQNEYFVSATGLIRLANEKGHNFKYVKEMSDAAKNDVTLQEIFIKVGKMLGDIINKQQATDHFSSLIIGGGVSNVFNLLKPGYEKVCKVPYQIIGNSSLGPIKGVRLALKLGKENIHLIR